MRPPAYIRTVNGQVVNLGTFSHSDLARFPRAVRVDWRCTKPPLGELKLDLKQPLYRQDGLHPYYPTTIRYLNYRWADRPNGRPIPLCLQWLQILFDGIPATIYIFPEDPTDVQPLPR